MRTCVLPTVSGKRKAPECSDEPTTASQDLGGEKWRRVEEAPTQLSTTIDKDKSYPFLTPLPSEGPWVGPEGYRVLESMLATEEEYKLYMSNRDKWAETATVQQLEHERLCLVPVYAHEDEDVLWADLKEECRKSAVATLREFVRLGIWTKEMALEL